MPIVASNPDPNDYDFEIRMLGDQIAHLSLDKTRMLANYLQGVFNISLHVGINMGMPAGHDDITPTDQWEFDVVLQGYSPTKKIQIIKIVRAATGMGLKEAKDLVELVPGNETTWTGEVSRDVVKRKCPEGVIIKGEVSKEDADKLAQELREAGATVTIK